MQRPLWLIFLTILALGFILQRGAGAVLLYLSDGPTVLLAGFALQIAAALVTAVGLGLGRRWVVPAVVCWGVSVVATALLGALYVQGWPVSIALSQSLVVALATGALALFLRREFGGTPQDLSE